MSVCHTKCRFLFKNPFSFILVKAIVHQPGYVLLKSFPYRKNTPDIIDQTVSCSLTIESTVDIFQVLSQFLPDKEVWDCRIRIYFPIFVVTFFPSRAN